MMNLGFSALGLLRVRSFGLQRRVVLRYPDVSEEHTSSIITVEEGTIQKPAEAGSKFSDMFLRNVRLSSNYTVF
jgi:hypothetical protein